VDGEVRFEPRTLGERSPARPSHGRASQILLPFTGDLLLPREGKDAHF
jgi:hypothetical protein